MRSGTTTNTDAYADIAHQHSLGRLVDVQRVKTGNDIDRLVTSGGAFFCKTYTKPWYGSPDENAFPVRHEAGAYAALRAHGLATPDVVVAEPGSANPLGRPYLLMRELEGTTIKRACSMGLDIAPLLRAAGRYLGRMHSIVFRYPGYVCSEHGPTEEPSSHGWRHMHWAGTHAEILERILRADTWAERSAAVRPPRLANETLERTPLRRARACPVRDRTLRRGCEVTRRTCGSSRAVSL